MEKRSNQPARRDNIYLGAFLGLIFPVIGFLLYYLFFFYDRMTISAYWDFLFTSGNIASALSLAIILNLPVFFLNIWSGRYQTVRGVVGATIFYGILIVIFKFS